MGIEPTRGLSPDPSLVLKTRGGTSRPNAPRKMGSFKNSTIIAGIPIFQGRSLHCSPNIQIFFDVCMRLNATLNVPRTEQMRRKRLLMGRAVGSGSGLRLRLWSRPSQVGKSV
jgi:hypothetical protein